MCITGVRLGQHDPAAVNVAVLGRGTALIANSPVALYAFLGTRAFLLRAGFKGLRLRLLLEAGLPVLAAKGN